MRFASHTLCELKINLLSETIKDLVFMRTNPVIQLSLPTIAC